MSWFSLIAFTSLTIVLSPSSNIQALHRIFSSRWNQSARQVLLSKGNGSFMVAVKLYWSQFSGKKFPELAEKVPGKTSLTQSWRKVGFERLSHSGMKHLSNIRFHFKLLIATALTYNLVSVRWKHTKENLLPRKKLVNKLEYNF